MRTDVASAFIILALAGGICIGFFAHKALYNRKLRKLSQRLDLIMRGDYSPSFSEFREGAFGMLTSQVELTLLRTQNAVETANREKKAIEQFISDFSHQIKTPLAGIISYLDLWSETETDVRKARQLELAGGLASRIEQLIRTLLELSRLESGNIPLKYTELSLLELANNAKFAAAAAYPSETREINVSALPNETLRGDEKWLTQALVNLVSNALVYSVGEGCVDISVICSENTVIFRVTNPGEIPRDVADNMFRRFYRKSLDSEGFGLGLSIAQSIARLHKGDVRAESANGKTTLVFSVSKNGCADSI